MPFRYPSYDVIKTQRHVAYHGGITEGGINKPGYQMIF